MLPFRVQCETCQARLRVRDASVVGQVHGCPRCGSMVLLTPPAGWGEESANAGDTPAATPPAEPAAAPMPVAEPQPTTVAEQPPEETVATALADQEPPTVANTDTLAESLEAPLETPSNQPTEPATAPADASPFVVAPAESRGRWLGIAVAGGVGVTLLAVGLVAWAWRDNAPQAASENPTATEAGPLEPPAPPIADAGEEAPPDAVTPATPTEIEPSVAVEQPGVLEPEPVDDTLPPLPPPAATASEALPEEPPTDKPATADATAESPPAAVAFDPLDLDPDSLDLILTRGPRSSPPAPSPPPSAPALDADLDTRLAHRAAPDGLALVNERLGAMAVDARAVVRRGPTGPWEPPAGDPLAVEIPEIQVADMPLDRVYRLLGGVTGAPITIDPAALRHAGIQADRPVALRGVGATVGELINQASEPLRLEVNREGGQLVVVRRGGDRPRQASYRVDDLLPAGEPDAGTLVEMIETLLPNLPARLRSDGARLSVDGSAAAHLEVAILCERLRKARGLKPRSRYPSGLLRTTPALADLRPQLDRRTTFTFVEFTPLAEVIDHWRRTSGLVILVDWRRLADLDLRPTSTLACSVNDRPWADALDSVLGALDLDWRAVDGRTIQITSSAAAASAAAVEFYRVPAGVDPEDLERSAAVAGAAEMWRDDASGRLLVRGTTATHRAIWRQIDSQ